MTNRTLPTETLVEIARRAARRYAYLTWLDQEEVTQEALTQMLTALRSFGGQPGNLPGYLTRTAQYAVRAFVWRTTSPVKHTDRSTIGAEASAVRRASVEKLMDAPAASGTPEEQVGDGEWLTQVRVRFASLMLKDADVDQVIAWRVLLEGETPEQVARSEEVPVRAVHVVTQRMRNRILRDVELSQLLQSKITWR